MATSARTITSAALIMIAVFVGFAFAGMPLVAQLGVACAVAIAVDATVVRLVLVPSLMAMFDRWNWWLPGWLNRLLPSVDFDRPLPKLDAGDVVVIPDDISSLAPPPADMRMVVRNAARLWGTGAAHRQRHRPAGVHRLRVGPGQGDSRRGDRPPSSALLGRAPLVDPASGAPVTMWRGRLAVALDALATESAVQRRSPVETTTVQLPTGDRLQIPTAAETLRMKGLPHAVPQHPDRLRRTDRSGRRRGVQNAARVLGRIDGYYSAGRRERLWIATQLVRRLADPIPSEAADDDRWSGPDADARWDDVRQRSLSLAVAIMEEDIRELTRPYQRVDDTPVEFWPTAAIREALHSGDITVWQRIVVAIKRDPYGRTARQVEEVLQTAARGVSQALTEVPVRARNHLENNERTEARATSGFCANGPAWGSRSSPPGSASAPATWPRISTRR